MIEDPVSAIAVIAGLSVVCQWVASRVGVPSVLFLLVAGVGLSPVLDPDAVFGELLFAAVGLGVAVLLFEGGTSLHWRDLTIGRAPVLRLVSIGALITWAVGTAVALVVLDVEAGLAVLVGAVLIVSGPTVVIPLLRVVRPREPVGSVLRWEGIVIDPVGAGIAIVVLDALIEERSASRVVIRAASTFGAGLAVGAVITAAVLFVLRRKLVADHLQVAVTLAAVVGAYGAANAVRPEAGLIAVTLLGIAFANQKKAPAHHIAEFNEHLATTILGVLFVVLGARVELSEIVDHLPASLAIAAALMFVGRPLTVLASTLGTQMAWKDRGFLMALAPRGVVAAAVASLFALELDHEGIDSGPLVPVVFTVVVITVAVAGTTAAFVARRLRVAQPSPNGVALIGGGGFAVDLARALGQLEIPTIHIGLDDASTEQAALAGQLVYSDRLDTETFEEVITAVGVHCAIALSDIDHLNGYATQRLATLIDNKDIYGLFDPVNEDALGTSPVAALTPVLPRDLSATRLQELHDAGARVRIRLGPSHPNSGWATICRVDREHNVTFDSDPSHAGESDHLVQFGPGIAPDKN